MSATDIVDCINFINWQELLLTIKVGNLVQIHTRPMSATDIVDFINFINCQELLHGNEDDYDKDQDQDDDDEIYRMKVTGSSRWNRYRNRQRYIPVTKCDKIPFPPETKCGRYLQELWWFWRREECYARLHNQGQNDCQGFFLTLGILHCFMKWSCWDATIQSSHKYCLGIWRTKKGWKGEKFDWCCQGWHGNYCNCFPFSRPGVIHLTSRTKRPRCDISTNIVKYLQILSYVMSANIVIYLFLGVWHAVDKNVFMWTSMEKKQSRVGRQTTWENGRKKIPSPRIERRLKWLVIHSYHSSQLKKETELTTVSMPSATSLYTSIRPVIDIYSRLVTRYVGIWLYL